MQYRPVPGTSLRVSAIGFGCGGNAGLMVRGAPAEQSRAVARALDLGITYFDNAPDYGEGVAEEALGRALREVSSMAAVVTTKVEVRRHDLGDVAGHVVRSAHASLRRLRRERIDILMIHNGPVAGRPVMQDGDYHTLALEHFTRAEGAMEGVRRLQEAGLVAHAGFVCRGGDGPEVRQLLDTGAFRMVNVPYSLLNQSAGGGPAPRGEPDLADALGAARQRQCAAAVFSPLAGGLLAGRADRHALARPLRDPSSKADAAARFAAFARSCGGSMAQAAYRFVLAHPGVTTVLGGFSSPEQMEEIAITADLLALPPALLADVSGVEEMQA